VVGGGVFLVARGVTLLPFSSFQFHISFFSMLVMYTVLFSSLFFLVKKKENETRETKKNETWSPVISF
jgi:membrane protein implicated in regulation of membrane protease activity